MHSDAFLPDKALTDQFMKLSHAMEAAFCRSLMIRSGGAILLVVI